MTVVEDRIRLMIVDDHAVVRKGLVMVLRMEPDFEIVGEAENGAKAVELARQLQPDLVLLDFVMPEMDGEATALALQAAVPNIRILMLTGIALDERVLEMLAVEVDGYVMKDIEPDELAQAIRTVARGEAYLHPTLARRVLNRVSRTATSSARSPSSTHPA